MQPNHPIFSTKNQVEALIIFQDYGILSRHVLASELGLSLKQAEQLIDFLFLQGFLTHKERKKTEDIPVKHSCMQGCEGCPFNSIAQCHEETTGTNHYFLTEKAISFLKTTKGT